MKGVASTARLLAATFLCQAESAADIRQSPLLRLLACPGDLLKPEYLERVQRDPVFKTVPAAVEKMLPARLDAQEQQDAVNHAVELLPSYQRAQELYALRKQYRLTQKAFAARLGLTTVQYRDRESAWVRVTEELLHQARALRNRQGADDVECTADELTHLARAIGLRVALCLHVADTAQWPAPNAEDMIERMAREPRRILSEPLPVDSPHARRILVALERLEAERPLSQIPVPRPTQLDSLCTKAEHYGDRYLANLHMVDVRLSQPEAVTAQAFAARVKALGISASTYLSYENLTRMVTPENLARVRTLRPSRS